MRFKMELINKYVHNQHDFCRMLTKFSLFLTGHTYFQYFYMENLEQKYIIFIDGPHGVGKTSVLEEFVGDPNFGIVEENFVDRKFYGIDQDSLSASIQWFIENLSKARKLLYEKDKKIVVMDRGPATILVYRKEGYTALGMLEVILKEHEKIGITFINYILLKKEKEIMLRLRKRMHDLQHTENYYQENTRLMLKEQSDKHLTNICKQYNKMTYFNSIPLIENGYESSETYKHIMLDLNTKIEWDVYFFHNHFA